MRKFLFFLFFVCVSAPSFANQCGDRSVVMGDGNQLLYYDAGINAVQNYIECDNSENNNFMVGCDGKIYKCNGKEWEPAHIKKNCPPDWGTATSQRNRPENTILNPTDTGDIYFFTPRDKIYVVEDSICAYTTQKCDTDYDNCIRNKGVPTTCIQCNYGAGAKPSVTKCIYVKDDKSQNIFNVKFLYNGFKIKTNQEISIAKYDSASKCYLIEWHPENNDNVTVSAQGFTPVIMRVKELLNTDSIQLSTDGSANPQQNTSNTNSVFELQYNEKTNLRCSPNSGSSHPASTCKLSTQVIDINGNLQECTSTGWKKINDEPASCTGALEELETTYRDIDRGTSIYNAFHGKGSKDLSWIYFYDYDNDHNCIGAIKNPCKYSFEKYKKANAECEEKDGQFLSNYDNMGNIILCDTNTSVTVTDEKQQPLTSVPTGTKENECIKSGGDDYKDGKCICDADKYLEEYEPENAPGYSICRCIKGYHRDGTPDENGKYPATGECVDAGDYETHEEFDSAAWRRDTENAYKHERDNAQSWANKGVTAASTLMTGEGAMMAARAIAEKIADDDAEEKMAEWISKMGCEYGNGQQVNLGKEETLPAGDLAKYYTEYKQLADKLKETKTALNLRPGIESEVLYDRAETGLYQYANAERQSGGFTSLSRALMNPDGADAEQWNAQRAETNRDLLIGGALATVGLAGSYIANRAINKDHVKKYKELEEKFNKIEQELLNKYPEVFEPVEQEVTIEEVTSEESPITPEEIPAQTIKVTITKTAKAGAFKSGGVTLTEKGQAGITEAITNYVEEINKYTDINNIKITATGHADPQQINPKNINAITNEYKSLLNNSYLFTGEKISRIDSNENLTKARAQVVVSTLIEAIIDSNQLPREAKQAAYEALGTNGDDCEETKKTEFEKCRYVDIKIEFQATPKSTQ